MSGLDLEALIKRALEQELKEALREFAQNLDHVAIQSLKFYPDKNALFFAYSADIWVSPEVHTLVDANSLFEVVATPAPPVPPGSRSHLINVNRLVGIHSKITFPYGSFGYSFQCAPFTDPNWRRIWLGAELTGGMPGGGGLFLLTNEAAQIKVEIVGATCMRHTAPRTGQVYIDVTALMLAEPSTRVFRYHVKLNRSSIEYYVDNSLIGIIQFSTESDEYSVRTTAPYVLHQLHGICPVSMAWIMEWICDAAYVGQRTNHILDNQWGASGNPSPQRTLHPYTGGDAWQGKTVDPSITSDAIPIAGYKHKTVYFLADEAGTLDISVDYGDNAFDSLTPTPLVVTANELLTYPTENDGLWLQLTFTPDAAPADITRARVMMSD